MVTALVLHDPELASTALFGSSVLRPLHKLVILRKLIVVDFVNLLLQGGLLFLLLHLLTALLNVVYHLALEAVLELASRAEVVRLALLLLVEEIITVFGGAFEHVGVLVTDLLPLELLTPSDLLLGQEVCQVW